ncbi:hypothetical protein, partial [Burkholderia multivorans]
LAAPVTTAVLPLRSAAMSVSFCYRIDKACLRRARLHPAAAPANQPLLCTIGAAGRAQNV